MHTRGSRRRRPASLGLAVLLGAATAAVGSPSIAQSTPAANCPETFAVFVPGTWETDEGRNPADHIGMLAPIADDVRNQQGDSAETYFVPYMARAFDNGHSYADSKQTGLNATRAVIQDVGNRCPGTQFTMTGYSQGADIAGDIASEIGNGNGPIPADRMLGVGLIADPGSGTQGEIAVGPATNGQGIADPRPAGMGALSGRVASICDPGDLYCAIDKGQNPLLASIGQVLSKTPATTALPVGADQSNTGGNGQLATALTSNFAQADLPGLASDVVTLGSQLTSPNVDLGRIVNSATSIASTLTPMLDLITTGVANPAAQSSLASAAEGTPERSAAHVLQNAGASDLAGALSTVTSIADTARRFTAAGTTSLPANSPDVAEMSTAANSLGTSIAPMTSTPIDALSTATGILGVLKPTVVVGQLVNVATGVTSLDIPGILHNLTLLPQKVAALDARGAHEVAGQLNNQFSPLVKMAAGVDLSWISSILSIIPDPSGYTQIAAMVTSILGNVDIIRLANLVGQIQEIAWTAIEKLVPPPGGIPDPLGAAAAMTGLLPVGLDLASVAVNALTGKVTKTSPQLLGQQNQAVSSITNQAANFDLGGLANSVATMAQSQGATDLARLVGEGVTAASFFASRTHTGYGNLVVDNAGRNAITWMGDWQNLLIGRSA